jgi:hypothetical protein
LADDNRYDRNFVVQQGLEPPAAATCRPLSAALRFQPRLIAPLILIATLTQSAGLFLLLACVQWWSALVPTLNPFDALYRVTVGRSSTAVPLPVARAPRRFSMGMAGTFALFTSLAIYRQWWPAAYTLEAFFVVAVTAVAWGRLCFGSFLYYLFRGQVKFAVQTLPWGQGV